MNALAFFWVGCGGAVGACSRYAVALAMGRNLSWLATLGVNIAGCLLLGMLWQYCTERYPIWWATTGAPLFATGFCGAFTTMSAFALETRNLATQFGTLQAGSYVIASVTLSLVALLIGIVIVKAIV